MSFGYDAAVPILKGISFRVEAGQRVAIVGPSGAGRLRINDHLCKYIPDSIKSSNMSVASLIRSFCLLAFFLMCLIDLS